MKDIAKLLNASVGKPSQSQLQELSSKFYTVVPHSFGQSDNSVPSHPPSYRGTSPRTLMDAVACCPLLLLTCALLMTSSRSEGRSVPPVIKTKAAVKNKLEMCQSLADIVVAQTILKSVQVTENPIDACFEKLKIEMASLTTQRCQHHTLSNRASARGH